MDPNSLPSWVGQVNSLALGWYTAIRAPQSLPALTIPSNQAGASFLTPGGAIGFGIDRSLVVILGLGVVAIVAIMLWKK